MAAVSAQARCPLCDSVGPIGAPCGERVCRRQGVHFIPEADARRGAEQPASQREPLVGRFVGDYLITGRLGKGGFGKVLLALQRPMYKLRSALKLLEFQAADDRSARKILEKFQNEAAALAVLQHPNIVRLLQSGEHEGKPYMAMEYVPGSRTLQTEINRLVVGHGALEPADVQHVLTQILNGLEAAHAQDLIHRDVKPENVMLQAVVGDPWHVKLVDFGLAKDIANNRDTSMVLGTVSYMSPEQIEGKDLGPWTDLYAVGAIAFELLLGRRPITGKDAQEILRHKLDSRFDPAAAVPGHGLPPAAMQFLSRALARWPEARFRSTGEMRDALGGVFADASGTAMFSRDLSQLMDSEELAHIKSEELRLADQRKQLEEEWKRLDAARKDLESERVRLGSQELGRPEEVEYIAHGSTAVVEMPPIATPNGSTVALPTGAPALASAPDVDLTHAATPSLILGATPPRGLQTGAPGGVSIEAAQGKRRHGWLWAGLAALAVVGVAVALTMSSSAPDAPGSDGIAADAPLSAEGSATAAEAEVANEPNAEARPPGAARDPRGDEDEAVSADPPEPSGTTADAPKTEAGPASTAAEPKGEALGKETTLLITSTPPGAEVFVDGVLKGRTPYTLKTRVGEKHDVELRAKGRPPEVREVVVERELATFEVPLRPVIRHTPRAKPSPAKAESAKPETKDTTAPAAKDAPPINPIYVDDK